MRQESDCGGGYRAAIRGERQEDTESLSRIPIADRYTRNISLRVIERKRNVAAGYVWRALVFILPSLIGLVWLISVTDPTIILEHWLFLLVLFIFLLALSMLWLELHFITASGSYRSERRSFWGEALWSGVLVFGPSVAWLGVILPWASYLLQQRQGNRFQRLRIFSHGMFRMSVLLPTLVEVSVYQWHDDGTHGKRGRYR